MRYALLSVSNKEVILKIATALKEYQIDIIASNKTALFLKKNSIKCELISEYINFVPLLEGRIKTLSPKLYASILANRSKANHLDDLTKLEAKFIDFVIIDLYPFTEIVVKGNEEDIIENIDIGGISLIRAAAKNYQYCTVISDKENYDEFLTELSKNRGKTTLDFRKKMARDAFRQSSSYDIAIANWFEGEDLYFVGPPLFYQSLKLSYGENPHQKAAFYNRVKEKPNFIQLGGKALSYNNIIDIDTGIMLIKEFKEPTAAVIKHNNPCGLCSSNSILKAVIKAFEADLESSFGGIVTLNQKLDLNVAKYLNRYFLEVIIAPSFTKDALDLFKEKPSKCRLIQYNLDRKEKECNVELRSALNGLLIQDSNKNILDKITLEYVTKRKPTAKEIEELCFAYKVARFVKSNAIVISSNKTTHGIGGGQTSRIGALRLAFSKVENKHLNQAVIASDGFFPFNDSIDFIATHKISAIIQPGGSIRDYEIIERCNQLNISMVFTALRIFNH